MLTFGYGVAFPTVWDFIAISHREVFAFRCGFALQRKFVNYPLFLLGNEAVYIALRGEFWRTYGDRPVLYVDRDGSSV